MSLLRNIAQLAQVTYIFLVSCGLFGNFQITTRPGKAPYSVIVFKWKPDKKS